MKLGSRSDWAKRDTELYGKDDCLFCDYEMQKEYIVWSGKYWDIKVNKYPYTNDKFHLLAMPNKHYERSLEVPQEEWAEMYDIHKFISKYFQGLEYFSFTRESFGSRSLKHLHIHFIKGNSPASNIVDMIS